MKNAIFSFNIFLFAICFTSCSTTNTSENLVGSRPNIVFIIADDMAWDDCGAYGHPKIHTPNIDKLANSGMRFDQAYLTASSCSPSRASIITGNYPHNTNAEQLHWPLPPDNITFVEHLKTAGYWTAQAGKWHMGDSVINRFDEVYDVGTAGFQLAPDGKKAAQEGDGSGCENWVPLLQKRPKDKPFFLWLAAVDPHRPYKDSIIDNPHHIEDVIIPPYMPDTKEVREDFVYYYNEIARLDSYVGKVVAELERQGISDNTLILFISDNGRPFPREKTTLYDGGIKTPWIVKWPGKVKTNSICKSLVSSVDIAPAFLTLAGLKPLPSFAGADFSELLTHPEKNIRQNIYAEDHWHDYEDFGRAIRTKEFKYIRNFYTDLPNTPSADAFAGGAFKAMRKMKDKGELNQAQLACFTTPRAAEELYDVVKDPFELKNLAANPQYHNQLVVLREEMTKIRTATNDTLPAFRTPDEFDRTTGQSNAFRRRPRPSKKEMEKIILKMNK